MSADDLDTPVPFRLTPKGREALARVDMGATLIALDVQLAAHVPLSSSAYLGAGEEMAPHGPTLPGTDLDARGVVVRRGTRALSRQLGRGAFLEVHPSGLSAREREILERAEDLGADCS